MIRPILCSSYAALYYPWVKIVDPTSPTGTEILLPPSGFVAGIYARSDQEAGPHKAPANEVVTDAVSFELLLNKAQQEVLNPIDVNCFRYFPGRGYLLWGLTPGGPEVCGLRPPWDWPCTACHREVEDTNEPPRNSPWRIEHERGSASF